MTADASVDGGAAYVPGSGPPGSSGPASHPQSYGGYAQHAQQAGAAPGGSYPAPSPHTPPTAPYAPPNAPYSARAPQVAYAPNSPYPATPPYPSVGQQPYGGYRAPAQAPGVGPVVAFTAFFGIWGAISAWRRARRAEAAGLPGGRYWSAFGLTLVVSWIFWMIVGVGLALVVPSSSPPVSATWLQDSIVREGDFKDESGAAATVRSALCTAGDVDAGGAGAYRCLVVFGDGQRQSYEVTVDADGRWVTD